MAARKKTDDTDAIVVEAVEAVDAVEVVADGDHCPPDPGVYQPDGRPVEGVGE
jgi:hypothetical protein